MPDNWSCWITGYWIRNVIHLILRYLYSYRYLHNKIMYFFVFFFSQKSITEKWSFISQRKCTHTCWGGNWKNLFGCLAECLSTSYWSYLSKLPLTFHIPATIMLPWGSFLQSLFKSLFCTLNYISLWLQIPIIYLHELSNISLPH